jgi:CRP-like cAMP-binding protein
MENAVVTYAQPSRPLSEPSTGRSRLLAALSEEDRTLLEPHLSLVQLARNEMLFQPGDEIEWAHFPCTGTMIALVVLLDGHTVETGLIGCEGAVGGIISRGRKPAFTRAVVQFPGEAWRIHVADLEAARARSVGLADAFARYTDCLLAQFLQTVACNTFHSLEQRMARALLAVQDHYDDAELPLTQEALGEMLGVGRTYVTKTAAGFQTRGLISYARGRVRVLDRPGLGALACTCQSAVRAHYERVLPGVYPAQAA